RSFGFNPRGNEFCSVPARFRLPMVADRLGCRLHATHVFVYIFGLGISARPALSAASLALATVSQRDFRSAGDDGLATLAAAPLGVHHNAGRTGAYLASCSASMVGHRR